MIQNCKRNCGLKLVSTYFFIYFRFFGELQLIPFILLDVYQSKTFTFSAKHVVSEKNDIQQAMEFLKQCPLVKIEDILPFFSDFVTIDHFKDAICTSLQVSTAKMDDLIIIHSVFLRILEISQSFQQVYNQRIQDLKDDMEEASKSAELIRSEIHSFRNRYLKFSFR